MITIDFSQKELDLLLELLQNDQTDLQAEIAHTDALPFKAGLKLDRTELQALIAKLKGSEPVTSKACACGPCRHTGGDGF